MTKNLTRGQEAASDIAALLRARNPLLWVVTREEARAEGLLFEAAASAGYVARFWDCAQGATEYGGKSMNIAGSNDPGVMMQTIATERSEREVWIMRDLPAWLAVPTFAAQLRQLRNLARSMPSKPRDRAQAIIVLTTVADVPSDLQGHATVKEWPLPDREEIAAILDETISKLPAEMQAKAAPNGTRDAAIDAAVGLTGEEASACYARSLIQMRRIDPTVVAMEKKRVIARERVLEWYDPLPGGLDAVGGLENLKAWLERRKSGFGPAAKAFGLPAPKGIMLVGVSGTGKSLSAKAIATAYGCPLLRFDLGALLGKYMGDSQGNIRKAFRVIEAIGRCVVWFDEIDKALAAGTAGAASDGGVGADQLGAILQWMQERAGEAFIVMTANDIAGLPPELLRKGRVDEVFFVDLPTETERASIAAAALRANGRGDAPVDLAVVAAQSDGFTGAEIAAIVPEAMFEAFNDGQRQITTDDLLAAARNVVPLKKTAAEKIAKLQDWAKGRAQPASRTTAATTTAPGRVLDLN